MRERGARHKTERRWSFQLSRREHPRTYPRRHAPLTDALLRQATLTRAVGVGMLLIVASQLAIACCADGDGGKPAQPHEGRGRVAPRATRLGLLRTSKSHDSSDPIATRMTGPCSFLLFLSLIHI